MSIIQLSSATDKVLNGIPLGNIPMKMLVCLIDGYYDIGPLDYLNFLFTVYKGDKSYFIWDWSLIHSLYAFVLFAGMLKDDVGT